MTEASQRRRWASRLTLVIMTAAGVDAFAIEPYALAVHEDVVAAPVVAPLVIAHVSDLHTHGYGRRERRLVELVQEKRPDLIIVTGDTVDDGDLEPARELFTNLTAPLGVWVVPGNWEHWKPPPDVRAFYTAVGAHLLVNESARVRDDVWIAGLDDPSSRAARTGQALRDEPATGLRLALFHAPELFDAIAPSIDVAFAGHTHGGQVRLPFLGAVWRPPGSGRFDQGWYSSGKARMYVSRGVGTSVLPVRFLCPPELEIVTLVPTPATAR